jgi:hypothetical protein
MNFLLFGGNWDLFWLNEFGIVSVSERYRIYPKTQMPV